MKLSKFPHQNFAFISKILKPCRAYFWCGNKGFTLIEMVVVFTLTAILSFAIGSFIVTLIQNWALIRNHDSAVNAARVAMNRITAELRRIKNPQNIITAGYSECSFLDIDNQMVDFKQSGANLLRNNDILASGLASPEGLRFTYLDSTGEATATKQNMRSIRVWLFISSGMQWTTLESSARIRNL